MQKNIWICIGKAGSNYDAYAPEAPGCITTGPSIEQTKENMREALSLYFEDNPDIDAIRGEFPFTEALQAKTNREEEYYYLVQVSLPEKVGV